MPVIGQANTKNLKPYLTGLSIWEDVFKGLGEIKGVQHKIQIDPSATPVVHPPRRVPVAVREPLKEELQRMEKLGVIVKAKEPTTWVHSLVVAKKKNNKIRVCMDPSDLNRAVMREHFPITRADCGRCHQQNA